MLAAARAPGASLQRVLRRRRIACAICSTRWSGCRIGPIDVEVDPSRLRPSDNPVIAGDRSRITRRDRLDAGDPDRADARRPSELLAPRDSPHPDAPLMSRTPALSEARAAVLRRRPATRAHGDGRLRAAAAIPRWWEGAVLAGAAIAFNLFVLPRIAGTGCIARPKRRGVHSGIILYPLADSAAALRAARPARHRRRGVGHARVRRRHGDAGRAARPTSPRMPVEP